MKLRISSCSDEGTASNTQAQRALGVPHEFEDFLLARPDVAFTAAIPLKTEDGLTQLRAFIVLRPDVQAQGTEVWEAQVRQRMEQ